MRVLERLRGNHAAGADAIRVLMCASIKTRLASPDLLRKPFPSHLSMLIKDTINPKPSPLARDERYGMSFSSSISFITHKDTINPKSAARGAHPCWRVGDTEALACESLKPSPLAGRTLGVRRIEPLLAPPLRSRWDRGRGIESLGPTSRGRSPTACQVKMGPRTRYKAHESAGGAGTNRGGAQQQGGKDISEKGRQEREGETIARRGDNSEEGRQ